MPNSNVLHTLRVRNESINAGNACIFQLYPDLGYPKVMSLAWLTKFMHPTTEVQFDWDEQWHFAWAETGELVPGVVFVASQSWTADLRHQNQVTLTYKEGAFTFQQLSPGPGEGSLYILEDRSIPLRQTAVGVGMAGRTTWAVQAAPNINLKFTPHPRYWLAFGNYKHGQVMDLTEVTNAVELLFDANCPSLLATLSAQNLWTVVSTSPDGSTR